MCYVDMNLENIEFWWASSAFKIFCLQVFLCKTRWQGFLLFILVVRGLPVKAGSFVLDIQLREQLVVQASCLLRNYREETPHREPGLSL